MNRLLITAMLAISLAILPIWPATGLQAAPVSPDAQKSASQQGVKSDGASEGARQQATGSAKKANADQIPAPEKPEPVNPKPESLGEKLEQTVESVTKAGGDVAINIRKTASEATKAKPDDGVEKAAKLINDIQDISFGRIILIILFTWFSIWAARRVLPYLAKRGPSQARLYLLGAVPIIRLVLLVTAIMWIVPLIFNITLQNFLVIAGAASVAIGFAFKDYASSLIAGIVAIFERPYRPGDWVKIDGDYGEVKSVGLRAISLVTAADDVVTVPHDRIWTNNISNSNDGARTLMCIADFYLAPGHDGARMRSALFDVAVTSAYLSYNKPVLVMLNETPWGTHYKLKAYPFDLRDQFSFISDMTVRGKLAIAEAGGIIVTAPAAVGGGDGQPLNAG